MSKEKKRKKFSQIFLRYWFYGITTNLQPKVKDVYTSKIKLNGKKSIPGGKCRLMRHYFAKKCLCITSNLQKLIR